MSANHLLSAGAGVDVLDREQPVEGDDVDDFGFGGENVEADLDFQGAELELETPLPENQVQGRRCIKSSRGAFTILFRLSQGVLS